MHETRKPFIKANQRITRQSIQFSFSLSFGGGGGRLQNRLAVKLQLILPAKKQIINRVFQSPLLWRGGGEALKLKKMKKQILFLAMFTLAIIFAGTNSAWGQVLNPSPFTPASTPAPTPTCVGTPQQPKAGIPYLYEFNTDLGEGGPATEFRFWATKDPDFISGTPTGTNQTDSLGRLPAKNELIDYSAIYLTPGTTNGVNITWHPDLLARTIYRTAVGTPGTVAVPTSTFVVGWATNGCTDNIKVWEIDPQPSFTVDIKNIDDATRQPAAYGTSVTQCVDVVRAAKYNATSFAVDYNFGWDTLYYEVVAANFATSWLPTFQLNGLAAGQTAVIGWATSLANAVAGTFIDGQPAIANATNVTGTAALTSSIANTTNGVSLFVRVVKTNNAVETLAQETITLAVAGTDAKGLDITDDGTDCIQPTDVNVALADDIASRTIDPRPTLQPGTTIILPIGVVTTP